LLRAEYSEERTSEVLYFSWYLLHDLQGMSAKLKMLFYRLEARHGRCGLFYFKNKRFNYFANRFRLQLL